MKLVSIQLKTTDLKNVTASMPLDFENVIIQCTNNNNNRGFEC